MSNSPISFTADDLLAPSTNNAAPAADGSGRVGEFVKTYLPLAEKVSKRLGVAPQVLLGQWGLETGWGKSVVPGTNNLGNIKDFSGEGPAATDNMTGSRDSYRAYASPDVFGDDFAGLIGRRYRTAVGSGADAEKYFGALKTGGYAEDPNYVRSGVAAANLAARHIGAAEAAPDAERSKYYGAPKDDAYIDIKPGAAQRSRSAFEAINDTVIEAGNAVASGAGAVADFVAPGNRFSRAVDEFVAEGEAKQSDVVRAEKARLREELEAAETVGDEVTAVLGHMARSPVLTAAQMAGMLAVPGASIKGARGAAQLLGAGVKGAEAAGAVAGVASGAALGGGDAAGTAYELVQKTPDDVIAQSPEARELLGQGKSMAEVKHELGQRAAREASVVPAALGALGGAVGAERILAAGGVAKRGVAKAAATGLIEGGTEAVEEGATTYAGQKAAERYNPEIDPTKGVAAAGAMGAVMGAGTGAAVAALSPSLPEQDPLADVRAKAAEPNSPLSKAALSGATAQQAIAPPAPEPQADPISESVARIQERLRASNLLDALRIDGAPVDTKGFLNDLATASSPSTPAHQREQALTRLNIATEWAEKNAPAQPGPQLDQLPGVVGGDAPQGERPSAQQLQRGADRDKDLQDQLAAATTEFEREQVRAQADVNRQQRMRAPAHEPTQNGSEATQDGYTAGDQARLEAAALAGKERERRAEDAPRQVIIDRALRNVEERGGVASPAEAQIFAEAGLGKPYDRIDESLAPEPELALPRMQDAPAPQGLIVEERRGQRDPNRLERVRSSVELTGDRPFATLTTSPGAAQARDSGDPVDAAGLYDTGGLELAARPTATDEANDASMRALEQRRAEARDEQDRRTQQQAAEATARANQRPDADAVITALAVRPFERTADQKATVDRARRTYTADQVRILQAAATAPFDLSATDKSQLEQLRKSAVREEQEAGTEAGFVAPAHEQSVVSKTIAAPDIVAPAGQGPAFLRKRRAQLEQLVGLGFETVERRGQEFFLRNATTGQELKLDGRADAQLARNAIKAHIDQAASRADTAPTDAQKEAGNYRKGEPFKLNGVTIIIENPRGSTRSGTSPDGTRWETKLAHHYGDIARTDGADGDKVDVFIGPRPDSTRIFVIDQRNADGSFDEHKVMMGFQSEGDARAGYLANYEPGWDGLMAITEMTPEQFKAWVFSGATARPASETGARTISVTDKGRSITLQAVDADQLPDAPSTARGDKHKAVTRQQAELLRKVVALFGKKVEFFADPGHRIGSDGFVMPGDASTVYINTKTTISPLAVVGHELMHLLRRENPAAYNAIAAVVTSRVKDAKGFREYYGDTSLNDDETLEELISDLNGNLMSDGKFWGEVFAKIESEHDAGEAKGIIARLAALLNQLIAQVTAAFKGEKTFESHRFIEDSKAVREAFRDALAQYAKAAGITRAAMQAEVLRAEERARKSLRRAGFDKPEQRLAVSTAQPTAKPDRKTGYKPSSYDEYRVIDAADITASKRHVEQIAGALRDYSALSGKGNAQQLMQELHDTVVDNLLWLHDHVRPEARARAKLWYDGANRIANDWTKRFGLNLRQTGGVLAVLSPQMDWFKNVSLAERVLTVLHEHGDEAWSSGMSDWAESWISASKTVAEKASRTADVEQMRRIAAEGKPLKELSAPDAAYFVRAFDEAYFPRSYRLVTPEGGFGDFVQKGDGDLASVTWGGYGTIEKAVSLYRDPSFRAVDEHLGGEHKVRNFYNNIVDPKSADGHVTIDTHAVAAAFIKPLSGSSTEVLHNLGGLGSTAATGASGSYGLYADAYRDAAAQRGILAREMQSITWEAIRALFPAELKKGLTDKAEAVWDRVRAGELTREQARDEIVELSGGVREFAWENSGAGAFASDGATSFDAAVAADPTERQARTLGANAAKDKVSVSLSAATQSIEGLKQLHQRAGTGDLLAHQLLQDIALDSLSHLLENTSARINADRATGLYGGSAEPSLGLTVTFADQDRQHVLAALAKFAENFNQEQVHVRQATKAKPGTMFDDGSYATPVYRWDLNQALDRKQIQRVIDKSGLYGLTFGDEFVEAYYVGDPANEQAIDEFDAAIQRADRALGQKAGGAGRQVARLWPYGEGDGAIGFDRIRGELSAGPAQSSATARRVAEYLNAVDGQPGKVKTFEQADEISAEQAELQREIAGIYESLPDNDLKNPRVRKAYSALAKEVVRQFKALPVKVEVMTGQGEPYKSSADMRRDLLDNNHLFIFGTTPSTFGPEGVDFSGHPLLEDSGLKDMNGYPLLMNDLLRAVHDYYAHAMAPTQFGPKGEEAAWKNHMSMTADPWARWALTAETRGQNSWVNFRDEAQGVPVKDRPFARQKAALLPVRLMLTGDQAVDRSVKQFIKALDKKHHEGSAPAQRNASRDDAPLFSKYRKDGDLAEWASNVLSGHFVQDKEKLVARQLAHPALKLAGLDPKLPVTIDLRLLTHIRKSGHDEVTPEIIGRLADLIAHPRAVIRNLGQDGIERHQMLVDARDEMGRPILVALRQSELHMRVGGARRSIDVYDVRTVFGRNESLRYVLDQLRHGNVVWMADKEIAAIREFTARGTIPLTGRAAGGQPSTTAIKVIVPGDESLARWTKGDKAWRSAGHSLTIDPGAADRAGTAHFSRSRANHRWAERIDTADGPVFGAKNFALVKPTRLAVDDFVEDDSVALPMGHASHVTEGNTPYGWQIVDTNGEPLGILQAQVTPDGEIEAIHDIAIDRQKGGVGRDVVTTIAASRNGAVRILEAIPQSQGFWDKMGAGYYDVNRNTTLDWDTLTGGPESEAPAEAGQQAADTAGEVPAGEAGELSAEEAEAIGFQFSRGRGQPHVITEFKGLSLRRSSADIKVSAASAFADGPFAILPGVRELGFDDVALQGGDFFESEAQRARIQDLAEKISRNRSIEPLFVAVRADGSMYVAEGQHRARALRLLGHDSFPARVMVEGGAIKRSVGRAWNGPGASKFDDLVYKLQDKHVDTKRVVDAIKGASGSIRDDLDVYLQEELFHGRAAKATQDFVDMELQPLVEEMKAGGLTIAELDEYLHARHAREANAIIAQRNPQLQDGGSGMLNQDAAGYFAQLPAGRRQALEAAAAKVDAMLGKTRQLLVDYELESEEKVDGWKRAFQHYVPLMREDDGGHSGGGTGQGFSIKGKEVKSRTGSTRKVVDILANIAMQRERTIVRGEKNRVARALFGLAADSPNPDFWAIDTHVPTERVFNEKTGLVEDRPDNLFKQRPNVVVAKFATADGGVAERAVIFNEKDERAMRMAESLKNLDAAQLEGLLGASATVTRYFSSVNTQYNPVFGVVNLVRDVQGAILNLGSTELAGKQKAIARNTLPAMRGIYADTRAARQGKQPSSAWAKLWDEFQQVGGQTGYRDLFRTSADRAEAIQQALDPHAWMDSKLGKIFTANGALKVPLAAAQRGAKWIFDWLSDYNLAMENGIRLAAYKAALDAGMSKERAASLAKNLTVNFNRRGQAGQQAGALYAFFNASMQGSARIAQTLFEMEPGKPKTIRLSALGKKIVYGGMLLGTIQALALAAAGFGEDDPPEFARERSLIIPTGGKTYISIPLPLGFHVIPNIGRVTTEWALSGFDNTAKRATSLIGSFADAFNPIGNAGMSMQTLAPTALDPLVALTENRDWAGRPIARESSNKAVPGHALARDTSSTVAKLLSEGLNHLSGGTQYTAGVFSPTPDQIDYLIGQVTGGVGRELSKVEQTALSAARGEELPLYKVPLVGRFVGNAASQASEGNAFYANVERLNEIETEIKGLRKDGKADEANQVRLSNPEAYLITKANHAERAVQKLRKEKSELVKAGAPREQVRAIEEKITARMAALNRAVEALQGR